jgi:hypothetical protein
MEEDATEKGLRQEQADEIDALSQEVATIVDHATAEKRDLNRKERGRLRYVTGISRSFGRSPAGTSSFRTLSRSCR